MNEVPLYRLQNLKYRYDYRFLLHVPDYSIIKGSAIGLVGPNGGGKSTLLKLLAFLELPHEGIIYYNGTKADNNNTELQKNVTILLQEPYLLKRSVFENVAYGLKVRHEKNNIKDNVYHALGLVGLPPKDFAKRRWHELSGGEAQRVALAARLILRPEVLILDEPTASVDKQSAVLIKEAINLLREKLDTTLIIASHDLVWLNSVTDKIEKVYDGRIIGYVTENLIEGPWNRDDNGLWKTTLSDGQKISAVTPPDNTNASALLNPSDIMISMKKPEEISAQNILTGTISHMSTENDSDKMIVAVDVADTHLLCRITHHAADLLKLLPGKNVSVIFKASAVHWQ
jgi:tungstate transport system ATP-binding protein